ncbi:hypothetical protein PR002_g14485 [Phytophthora rubi]|uniref:Uncharacterized protein n=1 Tax=Phytophthora rubi TaxID=129364 RepID=A0A6A3L6A2_9STRA|nr:hypothetical protein PR002_g14485 [Phytophthora rubi]
MLLYKDGWEALSGVDRARFQFLKDANSLLPPGKQLSFYFANSHFTTELTKTKEVVVWRSITGAVAGNGSGTALSKPFNFLNPDDESLSRLWDNTRKSTMPECDRFAIAMWPSSADIVNQVDLMGIAAAIPTILLHDALSDATVRMLLKNDVLGSYNFALAVQSSKSPIQLLLFCQKLVPAIIKVGDVKLVKSFFKKYFDLLSEAEKTDFLPWLRMLVLHFGWRQVDTCIIAAIDCSSFEISLNRALVVTESLSDSPTARAELTVFAVGKAQVLCHARPDALAFSTNTGLLWKNAAASGNATTFLSVKNLVAQINPEHLGSIVTELSKYVDASSLPEHQAALAPIAWARRQWLINEILDCEKPFTWHTTNTSFLHSTEILDFLQSPTSSLVIRNFKSMSEARLLTAVLYQKIQAPLSITADRQGPNVVVQITKTGGQFDMRREKVPTYMAEIQRLGQLLPLKENASNANTRKAKQLSGMKRPRPREPEVITIE